MKALSPLASIRRLIVPLDESHESERALPIALRLAERLGVPVELLSVATQEMRCAPLRERLTALAAQAGRPVDSSHVLRADDVASTVARRARSTVGATVVIAGHGPTVTSGVLTESVSAELLAEGLSVVIIGPHAAAPADTLPVVVCLDGSDESEGAVPAAAMWADALDVPLVLLAVTRPLIDTTPGMPAAPSGDGPTDGEPSYPHQALRHAAHRARVGHPGLDVRTRVVSYPWQVADALALYLERHPAQLVVLAMHVRHGWSQLIHPSVTRPTIRQVSVPVLVVPIEIGAPADAEPASRRALVHGARPFSEIIMPIADADDGPDATMETATRLAVAADVPLSFFTCVGEAPAPPAGGAARPDVPLDAGDGAWSWHFAESGDVAATIVRAAEASPESIVCLGTTAPTRLADSLLSSVTGRIVRWSPRTVVLVGPRCVPPAGMYSEVVGCVDGSPVSAAVADLTVRWASSFGIPARILQVVDPAALVEGGESVADRHVQRLAAEAGAARSGINGGDRSGASPGSVADRQVAAETIAGSDAARALSDWAGAHPEALLVMASHGAGLSQEPLGGVVLDVVRHALTPVAVIPAHAGDRPDPQVVAESEQVSVG